MENRFFRRVLLDDTIKVMTRDGFFLGILDNISLSGLYLRTNIEMKVGDILNLIIPLTIKTHIVNILVNVNVVRSDNNGSAFKYIDINHNQFWTLHSFIMDSNA